MAPFLAFTKQQKWLKRPYSGSFLTKAILLSRMASWQAHLQRISSYLQYGEGVWWKALYDGYQFLDSDKDMPTNKRGPTPIILGINTYRMYGILVEQPGNQLWTQKRHFRVHTFGFSRTTNLLVDATFQMKMMNTPALPKMTLVHMYT